MTAPARVQMGPGFPRFPDQAADIGPVAMILLGVPESVREFRALVRRAALTEYQAEAAALCVSEIVTNAILHTPSGQPGGTVMVTIEPGTLPGEMRVSAIDQSPRPWLPPCPPHEICPEHGHGLAIVDAVAADWGISDETHSTWFEIGPAVQS